MRTSVSTASVRSRISRNRSGPTHASFAMSSSRFVRGGGGGVGAHGSLPILGYTECSTPATSEQGCANTCRGAAQRRGNSTPRAGRSREAIVCIGGLVGEGVRTSISDVRAHFAQLSNLVGAAASGRSGGDLLVRRAGPAQSSAPDRSAACRGNGKEGPHDSPSIHLAVDPFRHPITRREVAGGAGSSLTVVDRSVYCAPPRGCAIARGRR